MRKTQRTYFVSIRRAETPLIVSKIFLRFGKIPPIHKSKPTLLHHPTDTDILGFVHRGAYFKMHDPE